jgi:hypothetical protein
MRTVSYPAPLVRQTSIGYTLYLRARSAAFLIVCLADISGARAYDVHIICTRLWPLRDAPRYQP